MGAGNKTDPNRVTRREYMLAGLTGMSAGVAGCSGDDSKEETPAESDSSAELEILHRWTRGADGKAMAALLEAFGTEYPEIRVLENTLPARGNVNMKTAIRTRMLQENDPPSTWQTWPGQNLVEFTDETLQRDVLGDIETAVWDKNGMKDAYLDGPKRAAVVDDTYVSVPVNIHRMNALFYNVSVLEAAGVDPAGLDSPEAFLAAIEKVAQDTDTTPFAHTTRENWTTLQLWATVYLATGGYDQYQTFTSGDPGEVEQSVAETLQYVADVSSYIPENADSIEWPDAAALIVDGEAAFFHQGDWAAGVFIDAENFVYGEDWDWIPFPGTAGLYSIGMDGFTHPEPNRSPETTKQFLRFVGTPAAQETFNAIKGSIPPRTDISTEQFSEYQVDQIEKFQNSTTQPNTIAHGLAVTPETLESLREAIRVFTDEWRAEETTERFVTAVK